MDQPADLLKENERLRSQLEQVEGVLRAFRDGDVEALIDQPAASDVSRLRISEIRYRRIFEAAHDGILIVDPGTRKIIDANPFMINLLGYSLSELLGMEIFEIGLFSYAQANKDMIEILKTTGQIRYENLPLQTEDGALRNVEVVANQYAENGRSVIQFNIRDTTERARAEVERARAETATRESEARQAFLLQFSDALRAEPNADAISHRAIQMLFQHMTLDRCFVGVYRLAEDIGEIPHQVHDDRLPALPAKLRLSDFPEGLQIALNRTLVIDDVREMQGLSDGERESFAGIGVGGLINAALRKGENAPIWALVVVSASPRVWTPGEVSLVEEVAERTWAAVERALAKERLQVAHDTFRSLIDRSPFGTYIVDADFRMVQMSEGGHKAFGILRPLIGHDFSVAVHTVWPEPFASEVIARFRHTLATGEPFKALVNERRLDRDATEAYDWKVERIILPDGRFGVVCHFYDFTEQQQQKDHIKLLMGEVNHRSKNMLGLIEAIARQTVKTQPDHFVEIFGQRVRALSASQDLLVKGEWKAVELGELVQSQLAHFGPEHDGRITIEGPPLEITASASQSLGMALHELATNAVKFGALSNESGRLAISWSMQSDATGQTQFAMSWRESGGPPVAKPAHLGFGSTMIDSMLRASLGCDAEVDFAPTGLVWRIGCPAASLVESVVPSLSGSNGTAVGEEAVPGSGRRILVVDDEPLIAMDLGLTLSEAGYVVIGPAHSVAQALALLAQFGCDAALLDVNLGKETSEPVARELMTLGTPFASLSGYSREQLPTMMQTAPLLKKPVSADGLIAQVERCLAGVLISNRK